MNITDRINSIDSATDALLRYDAPRMQLVLRSFGTSTYDWEDNSYRDESRTEYVIGRLEELPDDKLAELSRFLAADGAALLEVSTHAPVKTWTECPTGVFLSHKFADAEFASQLSARLKEYGIEGFVAHKDIKMSDVWRAAIMNSLDTCDGFIALMHEEFHTSQWCDQEVGWALGRHVPVLVIRPNSLSAAPRLDGFMEQFQDLAVDRSNPYCVDFTVGHIIRFLQGRPELRGRLAQSYVWALEHAGRHPAAIAAWRAAESLEYEWPDDLLRRIRTAYTAQPFFRDAYTVPKHPYTLLKGYESSTLAAEPF